MAPSGSHGLLLRRELGRLFGLRLKRRMTFRRLGRKTCSTCLLGVGVSALLPLTATMIVGRVVGVTVGVPFLLLCHSALSV